MSIEQDVLIVEDDAFVRQQIAKLLQSQGFLVRQAQDGLEALRAIREGIPDLLISDLDMPVMNGTELIEEIVLDYPMIPVIILSNASLMPEVAKMLRLGVKDFLFKPINNQKRFLHSVNSVLKDSQCALNQDNDFCQQWFNVSEFSDNPSTKELKHHLDTLIENPVTARELLLGLMPVADSAQGNWHLNYHILQPSDINPVVLDYAWVREGKLAFYLVDSDSAGNNAVATTLMIRAFFNAFLRSFGQGAKNIHHLTHKIGYAIKDVHYASPIKTAFGLLDVANNELDLVSAGLKLSIDADKQIKVGENTPLLGTGNNLYKFTSIPMLNGSLKISLYDALSTSFLLKIERASTASVFSLVN